MTRQEYLNIRGMNMGPLFWEMYQDKCQENCLEWPEFNKYMEIWLNTYPQIGHQVVNTCIKYLDSKYNIVTLFDKQGNYVKIS